MMKCKMEMKMTAGALTILMTIKMMTMTQHGR